MAKEVVDRAVRELRLREGRPRVTDADTEGEPLPGGETDDFTEFKARGLEIGVVPESVEHLIRHYGTEAAGIYNLGAADRRLLRRLVPPHPAIEAEVLHAVRREMAQNVEDVMVRRTHLFYEHPERGLPAARRVAELMGGELGWDDERIALEAERYMEFAGQ
jgi:glycerol-3-phosphate dehydrogenase